MARQKAVVDASVLVKWFVDEQGSTDALRLQEDHLAEKLRIIVPELSFIEVINALRYKGGAAETLAAANRALWDCQFHVEKITELLLDKTAMLAVQHNLSMYDALYLAIAMLHNCALITADKKLARTPNAIQLSMMKH